MNTAFLISIGSVVLLFFLTAIEPVILVEPAKASPGKSFVDAQSLSRLFLPEDLLPRISQAQSEPLTHTLLMWLRESNPNPEKRIEINFAILLLRRKRPDLNRAADLTALLQYSIGAPAPAESLNTFHFSYSFIS